MATQTQTTKYTIIFPTVTKRHPVRQSFFALAKKHIIKGKRGARDLSRRIDKIAYGA